MPTRTRTRTRTLTPNPQFEGADDDVYLLAALGGEVHVVVGTLELRVGG